MKKTLVLTTAMAATLTALSGCSADDDWDSEVIADRDTELCVDQNGYRVDDDYCDRPSVRGGGGFYSWYYVSRGGRIPYHGDSVRDKRMAFAGSANRTAGAQYVRSPADANMTRSAAVARGGFGSSGRSYGGGRS
jgi:hypothetical protein